VTVSGSDNYTVSVKHDSDDLEIEIVITFSNSTRYWYINSIATTYNRKKIDLKVSKDYFAPFGFSYHCGGFNLTNEHRDISLLLPGFQIQPFVPNATFGDAYNCVGFTSVPIWSGLFVTFILLLIITFGLTMMMDIKTMDRFDDPKGKTITISATE
jgi:V-type H+-transporting ATPase S1 subunit